MAESFKKPKWDSQAEWVNSNYKNAWFMNGLFTKRKTLKNKLLPKKLKINVFEFTVTTYKYTIS